MTAGRPVLLPGLDPKHCNRTPSPQSSTISFSAATTPAVRRMIERRRAPVLASIDWTCRLRSQRGGRKSSSGRKGTALRELVTPVHGPQKVAAEPGSFAAVKKRGFLRGRPARLLISDGPQKVV